jgi:hypothetical protein
VAIDPTKENLKELLVQKPDVLTAPVAIDPTRKNLKERLAQKPDAPIAPVAIDPTRKNLKERLAQKPDAPIGRAIAANTNLTKVMLKKKANKPQKPAIVRKVVTPHPDREQADLIHPTSAHPAGAQARVLHGLAQIDRRYPSNAPSLRIIDG